MRRSKRSPGRHGKLPNPRAPIDVLEGLERFMLEEGIEDVRELNRRRS